MGRKSKLTPEIQEKIVQAVKTGNYYEAACGYAGIDYTTFRRWILNGEKAKSGKYYEFCNAIKKAEQEAEARLVAQWQKHMPEDWKAIATFLERRHPERWGKREKQTLEHTGKDGGPIETSQKIDLSALSTEELRQLEQIARKLDKGTTGPDRDKEGTS